MSERCWYRSDCGERCTLEAGHGAHFYASDILKGNGPEPTYPASQVAALLKRAAYECRGTADILSVIPAGAIAALAESINEAVTKRDGEWTDALEGEKVDYVHGPAELARRRELYLAEKKVLAAVEREAEARAYERCAGSMGFSEDDLTHSERFGVWAAETRATKKKDSDGK